MKSYPSTRCLLSGAPTPSFRAVSRSKEPITYATSEQRSKKPIRDEKSDQISSEEPRINKEVREQSA
jgi:hypothetical protein